MRLQFLPVRLFVLLAALSPVALSAQSRNPASVSDSKINLQDEAPSENEPSRPLVPDKLVVKNQRRSDDTQQNKYFHEPGFTEELGHYDARFFHGKVPYEQHRPALRHLIRSYLTIARALGVETWLAHGTLLGWWWNGKIMPWDYDLDVQVSTATLYYLGTHYNRTEHNYEFIDEETGKQTNRTYLLDVNSHHIERSRGDGMNIIDARWIDISNGMFIDITGLAEREPTSEPGIWSCKNRHRYQIRDLYPMRQSEFEGVAATVPYSFNRILIEEYGPKSLITTEWLNHRWQPELKEWIRISNPQSPI